jgi:hypothetical protein
MATFGPDEYMHFLPIRFEEDNPFLPLTVQ